MTTVISVRFRSGTKEYYFDPAGLCLEAGADVIVETAQGPEYVTCVRGNHEVEDSAIVAPLRRVLRSATENDRRTLAYNREREKEAYHVCQKRILHHGLEMKLVRVECSFDGAKMLFFFTADGRVDFRELVKDLAGVFRARIELRQIGVRDEAKMVGGLGICGRPFCCNSYMDDFVPVSIKMAKTQNLSLNPTKISGTCGRLMCCLKYEQDAYEDAIRRMPKNDSFVMTPDGPGNISEINLLREKVKVRLDDSPNEPRSYRSCELCVLRNGKGSRDGIDTDVKRPARYVEPVEEELPSLLSEYMASTEPETRREEEKERSGRRRGRERRRGSRNPAQEGKTVQKTQAPPVKAVRAKPADAKDFPGEKALRPNHRRGGRNRSKNADSIPKAPAPATMPVENVVKKPRHRGGRRHRGGGGGPKTGGEV